MTDWSGSMAVTYRYYEVDRLSWGDRAMVENVTSCSIVRDMEMDTRGQATFVIADSDMGERWIRCYAEVEQESVERVVLGTFLVQTPRRNDDGKFSKLDCTAYTSLHVLAEAKPNSGYALSAGSNCAQAAAEICRQHGIAPVDASESDAVLDDHYVAPSDSSWLQIATTLAAAANMEIGVDAWGRVVISPMIPTYARSASWTFRDDETSIILPGVSEEKDWYSLPNVCVVSTPSGIDGRAENADPDSKLSTVSRGREVTLKVDDPDELKAGCTQESADALALLKLREASHMDRTATISHGYCPVSVGEMVRVDAPSLSLNMEAIVKRQEMTLSTAMTVTSTLTMREEMWNGR